MKTEELYKERILAAAEDRLLTRGYSRMSVDDLTLSLGMSKKTFYKVFETKEEMLEAVVERVTAGVGREIHAITGSDRNFLEKLGALMAFLATVYRKVDSLLSEDIHRHFPALWQKIAEFRRQKIQENFSVLINQGIAEGHIRQDLNQKVFMMAFLAAIETIVRPHILFDEPLSARDAMGQILNLFFAGALTDRGRSELHNVLTHSPSLPR